MENMTEEHKKNVLDLFVEGARKGFTIGTTSLLPNVIMAFVIIRILDVTGLLHLIGVAFQPIMGLFTQGIMDPIQVTVMVPGIYLMGNPVQNVGRCLGISGVNSRHYFAIIMICLINTLLSIWAMRLIMLFF